MLVQSKVNIFVLKALRIRQKL